MRFAACILLAASTPAWAQQNLDLDRIPDTQMEAPSPTPGEPAPKASASHGKYYIEDAFSLSSLRNNLAVPVPSPYPARWQNRTSLDGTDQWTLDEGVTLTLSDRFNLIERNDYDFPSRQNVRNDFREGFLTWEPDAGDYLEGGRINVRNGVALGFNPTDYFKTRTAIDQASQDPSVARQNRLGTMMMRGQRIWGEGSASLSVAPKLEDPSPIASRPLPGFSPRLDRTNAANRYLFTFSYDVGELSPQALVYREDERTKFGLNLSHGIGRSVIAYAEWSGGKEPNLITQALDFGKRTGTFPAATPSVLATDTNESFRNDVAAGLSWSSESKVTINAEYLYHQAGFSQREWHDWFATGSARAGTSTVVSQLWYIRGFAADQQQPLTRHQLFLRGVWTDAFVSKLEITAFSFINLYDGSMLAQLGASYFLSDAWTLGGYLTGNIGEPGSERGTLPQQGSAIVQLVRYF